MRKRSSAFVFVFLFADQLQTMVPDVNSGLLRDDSLNSHESADVGHAVLSFEQGGCRQEEHLAIHFEGVCAHVCIPSNVLMASGNDDRETHKHAVCVTLTECCAGV